MTTDTVRQRVVVVVEDDRPIGELLAEVINDEKGYHAMHVDRPAAALRTLEQVKPDLLVLDVGLPDMSGFELLERVREDKRLRDVPVIFETALAQERQDEFRAHGITHVLSKPFEIDDLIRQMKQLAPVTD